MKKECFKSQFDASRIDSDSTTRISDSTTQDSDNDKTVVAGSLALAQKWSRVASGVQQSIPEASVSARRCSIDGCHLGKFRTILREGPSSTHTSHGTDDSVCTCVSTRLAASSKQQAASSKQQAPRDTCHHSGTSRTPSINRQQAKQQAPVEHH